MGTQVRTIDTVLTTLQVFPRPGISPRIQPGTPAGSSWEHVIVTQQRVEARRLMELAYYRAVACGVDRTDAERAIGGFRRYVDEVVAGMGTIRLCLGMVVDTVRAGMVAEWEPEHIGELLVKMQQQLDTGTSTLADLAATIGRIRRDGSISSTISKGKPLRSTSTPARKAVLIESRSHDTKPRSSTSVPGRTVSVLESRYHDASSEGAADFGPEGFHFLELSAGFDSGSAG